VAEVAATIIALARGDESAARAALAGLMARRPDLIAVLADDEDLEALLD
jgi:hypothetical protein